MLWHVLPVRFNCPVVSLSLANGAGEMQGIVGKTPPQTAVRTKSRQAKTPTQTGVYVLIDYISFLFGSFISPVSPIPCTQMYDA